MNLYGWIVRIFCGAAVSLAVARAQENLLQDPSFEQTKEKDRFGLVFAKWGGWKYEGAWYNATPDGQLIPAIHFEQLRAGLDDYRLLLTLARLAREKAGTPAAKAAEELLTARLAAFKLGQRDHDALFGPDDWQLYRRKLADAIEALR
jgi:hypothetical protein